MKNLFAFFVLIFVTIICGAQANLQMNKEGIYRLKPDSPEWIDVEITAHPEALKYGLKFSEAISKPGERILGKRLISFLKLKFLFKQQVEIKEYFIVYNSQTKNIDYIETTPIKKEGPSYLILCSISSIFLMIILNIFKKEQGIKEKQNNGIIFVIFFLAAFAFIVAFIVTFAFVFAGSFILALTFTFATIATFTLAVTAISASITKKSYRVASIIFYSFMMAHVILLFI